jgi:hypothetical protein
MLQSISLQSRQSASAQRLSAVVPARNVIAQPVMTYFGYWFSHWRA